MKEENIYIYVWRTSPRGEETALLPAVASSTVMGLSHSPYGATFLMAMSCFGLFLVVF